MNLTSLDVTLQRINMIENQFQSLMSYGAKPDEDFQKILDSSIAHKSNPTDTSRSEINDLIEKYAEKNGLDSDFVKAVVKQESGFNEKATSKCGAMGLMQLMPGTAKALNVNDPYNARDNIEGGVKYLKGLMDRFDGDMKLALAAYNAGPNAVKKYNGVPPYNETQNYVKNIMSMYQRIQSGGEL